MKPKSGAKSAFFIAILILAGAGLCSAQGTTGNTGSGGGGAPLPRPARNNPRSDNFSSPVFVSGRILTELNRPPDDQVTVDLSCGMKTVQVIHTDIGGYFTFSVGGSSSTFQSNIDFSASNEGPQPLQGTLGRPLGQTANPLSGCEIRIAHAGYMPITLTVPPNTDMNRVEMGVIRLKRIGGDKPGAVSVTSLMVPKDAAKEYERALKDLEDNKVASARPHLEKAVEMYPRYAEAWNELGRVRLTEREPAKAREAFERAVFADAEYYPPYINLAALYVQQRDWKEAVDSAAKALAIDAATPIAAYLFSIAAYNLHDLENAEKSALHANQLGEEKLPQVHSLLAEIYMAQENYPAAAEHAREYLQLAPTGPFAARMREGLSEMNQAGVEMASPADHSESGSGEKSGD